MPPAKSVIYLTGQFPFRSKGAQRSRDAQLIKLLMDYLAVELVSFEDDETHYPPENLQVSLVPKGSPALWKRAISGVVPGAKFPYSTHLENLLKERAEPGKLLWVSSLEMATYIPLARHLGYKIVLDEQQVRPDILRGGALYSLQHMPGLLLAARSSYYENRYCMQSDAVVAASDIEASRLLKLAPGSPIHVIPTSVDCDAFEAVRSKEGSALVFLGQLNHPSHVEGLHWFMREVLPRLRGMLGSRLPKIIVGGSNPEKSLITILQNAGIEVRPDPPSNTAILAEAAVVFIPVRSVGSARLRILEAMASGRAIVSTGKGAEGLVLSPSYDIWIADRVDSFTSAIARLIEKPHLRKEMGERAVETIDARYDWKCIRSTVETLLAALYESEGSLYGPADPGLAPK